MWAACSERGCRDPPKQQNHFRRLGCHTPGSPRSVGSRRYGANLVKEHPPTAAGSGSRARRQIEGIGRRGSKNEIALS